MKLPQPALFRRQTMPRSRSPKALANYSFERIERAKRALLDIANVYDDVDQTIVSECERLIDETLSELLETIKGAEAEGRGAE